MTTQTLIAPVTAAVSTYAEVNAQGYEYVTIFADALATTETCPIYVGYPGGYEPAKDSSGNAANLTATAPMLTFNGGGFYFVNKDTTAGACGVYVTYGRGVNG